MQGSKLEGGRTKGEGDKGVNMIKVRYMHVGKYHSETPLICTNNKTNME
jgi:hypothetical protein